MASASVPSARLAEIAHLLRQFDEYLMALDRDDLATNGSLPRNIQNHVLNICEAAINLSHHAGELASG